MTGGRRCRRLLASVALAVTGALALSSCEAYDLPLPGGPVNDEHSFQVTADFRSVLDLVPRSPVKVNDVTVGEVTSVQRVGWHATTTLRLEDSVRLPSDVVAEIRQTSLLGEKYVALEPAPGKPETGRLRNGDHIGLSQTGENPELEQVLGALSFLLNGGGVGQLKTITTELNKMMDGRQADIRHVLQQLNILVTGLDAQKQDIIRAMAGMNGLTRTLNREKTTVVNAVDAFGPAVKVLADQRAQLMTMLQALDRLGQVGTRVINASKKNILTDLRDLIPVVQQVAKANDRIPAALGLLVSFPFPIESNNIVHGDYANTSIVFSIDLNNLYQNFLGNSGSGTPGTPGTPGVPGLPGVPKLPGLPKVPGLPQLPGTHHGKHHKNGGGGVGLPGLPGLSTTSDSTSGGGSASDLQQLLGGAG